jgi:hypothetical protein
VKPLPWRNGLKLISLWDIMKTLDLAKAFQLAGGSQSAATIFDPNPVTWVEGPDKTLDSSLRESLTRHYTQLSELYKDLELPASSTFCTEIVKLLGSDGTAKASWLNAPTRGFITSVQSELASRLFLYVPYQNADLYQAPFTGWEGIRDSFPNAIYDVQEAAKCLGLQRSTASVFHCMRVLECGLRALATEFKVPTNHKAWGEIINQTQNAIDRIPRDPNKPADWKEYRQFCSEAAAQFMHFKYAWRNYAAHARVKYTPEEAEQIFRHVRDFMMHLAKRLKEPATS